MDRIPAMPEFTNYQLLLMQLRDTRCGGSAAELGRQIGKDGTYVHRLFYPIGKKGGKGIGLAIMDACNKAFGLPAGYWDSPPTIAPPLGAKVRALYESSPSTTHHVGEPKAQSLAFWPFEDVTQEQYNHLTSAQKAHVESGILLMLDTGNTATKQKAPANKSHSV